MIDAVGTVNNFIKANTTDIYACYEEDDDETYWKANNNGIKVVYNTGNDSELEAQLSKIPEEEHLSYFVQWHERKRGIGFSHQRL